QMGRERDRLRRQLYDRFSEQLIQLDLERMVSAYAEAATKWFLPKMLSQRRIVKELQGVAKPGVKVNPGDVEGTLSMAIQLRTVEDKLSKVGDRARGLLGRLWDDGEADWDEVQIACDWASAVRQL